MNFSLSIIIPAYNAEKYIGRCLDSIQNQLPTDNSVKVFVVNDGSIDQTEAIVNKYVKTNDNIFQIIQPNHGVSYTRNHGLEYVHSDFVTFIDGDDYVSNDYINILLNNLKEDVELICFNYYVVEDGNLYKKLNLKDEILHINRETSLQKFLTSEYFDLFFTSACNKVFRMNIIRKFNIQFDEEKRIGEDELFVAEYFQYISSVKTLSNRMYYYWYHQSSTLHKYSDFKINETLSYIDGYLQIARKCHVNLNKRDIVRYYIHMYYGLLANEARSKNYKKGWENEKIYLNHYCLKSTYYPIKYSELNWKLKIYLFLIKFHFTKLIYTILFIKKSVLNK